MKIELHLLQNFPPSCLNRDDTGQPKDCEFGGYRRARISSQCFKRAIRRDFSVSKSVDQENRASRTKRLLKRTAELLGVTPEIIATKVEAALKECDLKLKDGESEYLLFLGDSAMKLFAESLSDPKQASAKLMEATGAVDIALFGRMLANAPKHNVMAACQVSHAISTNRVAMEFDYFTAVDDFKDKASGDDAGAGMIGTVAYNSSCFYRYSVIDWSELLVNLGDNAPLARKAVSAFLHASVRAIPTGKQNTFAAHARPGFVLVVVSKSGPPVSLANAFLRPVQPRDWGKLEERRDLLEASAEALASHWIELGAMYGHDGIHTMAACWMPQELKLEALDDYRAADNRFDTVVNQALQALPGTV